MTETERRYNENKRELRRLQLRAANGNLGRCAGATFSAIDRRLGQDRKLLAKLAAEEGGE